MSEGLYLDIKVWVTDEQWRDGFDVQPFLVPDTRFPVRIELGFVTGRTLYHQQITHSCRERMPRAIHP